MINEKFEVLGKTINEINIEVFDHGYFTGGSEWNHHNVSSPFCRLYLVTEGRGIAEISGQCCELIPGKAYIIPPNILFDVYTTDHIKKFYIHFSAQLIPGNDIFDGIGHCLEIDWDKDRINELVRDAKNGTINDLFKFKARIFEIISLFLSCIDYDMKSKLHILNKYEKVYRYINDNLKSGLRADTVASDLNMSYSSLIKNYRTDTGITLNSYIRSMILRMAVKKLLYTELSIKEISAQLEFCDEFYFSRFFKKQTGMSPKAYREHNRL